MFILNFHNQRKCLSIKTACVKKLNIFQFVINFIEQSIFYAVNHGWNKLVKFKFVHTNARFFGGRSYSV